MIASSACTVGFISSVCEHAQAVTPKLKDYQCTGVKDQNL